MDTITGPAELKDASLARCTGIVCETRTFTASAERRHTMRTFMTSLVPVFLTLALAQPTLAQTGSSSPNIVDTQQLAPTASTPQTPAPGEALSVYGYASPVAEGIVVQYLMNPHGEVDGLLLSDGAQVHFPPHMEEELIAVVKPNDSVRVQGHRSFSGSVVQGYLITNTRSGQAVIEHEPSLLDHPAPPFLRNLTLRELNVQGRVRALLNGPGGEVHGAVLEDGTQVRVPPHVGNQLAGSLKVGDAINAKGYGAANQYGRALEATAIGISGGPLQPLLESARR